MKKIFYIVGSVVVIFFLVTFIIKINKSGVGKYVPINQGMILNTTNGNVYKVKESKGYQSEYEWEKVISFKNKN